MSRQGSRRVTFSPDINDAMTPSLDHLAFASRDGRWATSSPQPYRAPNLGFSPSHSHRAYRSTSSSFFSPSPRPCRIINFLPSSGSQRSSRNASHSPVGRYFRCIRTGVARAVRFLSRRRRRRCTSSAKVSASPNMVTLRFAPPRDSHYSEAIEDCIEFINTSYRKSYRE